MELLAAFRPPTIRLVVDELVTGLAPPVVDTMLVMLAAFPGVVPLVTTVEIVLVTPAVTSVVTVVMIRLVLLVSVSGPFR